MSSPYSTSVLFVGKKSTLLFFLFFYFLFGSNQSASTFSLDPPTPPPFLTALCFFINARVRRERPVCNSHCIYKEKVTRQTRWIQICQELSPFLQSHLISSGPCFAFEKKERKQKRGKLKYKISFFRFGAAPNLLAAPLCSLSFKSTLKVDRLSVFQARVPTESKKPSSFPPQSLLSLDRKKNVSSNSSTSLSSR